MPDDEATGEHRPTDQPTPDKADGEQTYGGRYEMHRRIARGGMADVYLARDSLLDRPVALKVLFPEFATDPTFVERFRREAQSAANLSHPNIVSVFDWGAVNNTYYIVMEYVEGRSLAQILKDEGPLHPDRAADIAIDVASALGFAHRNGVVHRDVKPGNVLVSPQGQVKVADFGIARAVTTEENLTRTGTVMGTATYFSPEQAKGEGVDPRSDVYSLGVVLFELLVGKPPFQSDNPVAVAYKHVQETPPRPSRLNPEIPAPLEAITLKALAKNPANRYASADELTADLRRFRAGQPVLAESLLPEDDATRAVAAVPPPDATRAIPRTVVTESTYGDEPPRRSPAFLIAIGVLLALLLLLLFILARSFGVGSSNSQGTVPDVVGMTQEEAEKALDDAGFDNVDTTKETDTTKAEGVVLAQDPGEGTELDKDSKVTLVVNTLETLVDVPDVVGDTREVATQKLDDVELKYNIKEEESDQPSGIVLSQDPDGGQKRERGEFVELVVSKGPPLIDIPSDLTNQSGTDAANRLLDLGFRTRFDPEGGPADAKVVSTDPATGTKAPKGSTVTIKTEKPEPTTTTTSSTTTTSTTSTTQPILEDP
jgi:beta-lactam-binding protein with PASTA domain